MNQPITLTPGKLYKRRNVKSTPMHLDIVQRGPDGWAYEESPAGKINNVFWLNNAAILIIDNPLKAPGVGIGIYQDKFVAIYSYEAVEM